MAEAFRVINVAEDIAGGRGYGNGIERRKLLNAKKSDEDAATEI